MLNVEIKVSLLKTIISNFFHNNYTLSLTFRSKQAIFCLCSFFIYINMYMYYIIVLKSLFLNLNLKFINEYFYSENLH